MHFEPGLVTKLMMEPIHLISLDFMVVVYLLRVRWILRFSPAMERTSARGSHREAVAYSWSVLAMPWGLEEYRRHPIRYVEFVIFHAGIIAAIGVSFAMPLAPTILAYAAIGDILRALMTLAVTTGIIRLPRRCLNPSLRQSALWMTTSPCFC